MVSLRISIASAQVLCPSTFVSPHSSVITSKCVSIIMYPHHSAIASNGVSTHVLSQLSGFTLSVCLSTVLVSLHLGVHTIIRVFALVVSMYTLWLLPYKATLQ